MARYAARAAQSHIGMARAAWRATRTPGSGVMTRSRAPPGSATSGMRSTRRRTGTRSRPRSRVPAPPNAMRPSCAGCSRPWGGPGSAHPTTARPLADQPVGEGAEVAGDAPGRDMIDRALVDLFSVYRDALVLRSRGRSPLINEDSRAVVEQVAQSLSDERLLLAMESIGTARERIAHNAAPAGARGDGPGPAAASLSRAPA